MPPGVCQAAGIHQLLPHGLHGECWRPWWKVSFWRWLPHGTHGEHFPMVRRRRTARAGCGCEKLFLLLTDTGRSARGPEARWKQRCVLLSMVGAHFGMNHHHPCGKKI